MLGGEEPDMAGPEAGGRVHGYIPPCCDYDLREPFYAVGVYDTEAMCLAWRAAKLLGAK